MIRLLISVMVVFSAGSSAFAQSLVFMRNGVVLPNDTTITVSEIDEVFGEINPQIVVLNTGSSDILATFTVTTLEEPVGGNVGFCGWGSDQCIPVPFGSPKSRTTTVKAGQEEDPAIETIGLNHNSALIKTEYKVEYSNFAQRIYVTFLRDDAGLDKVIQPVSDVKIIRINGQMILKYHFTSSADRRLKIYDTSAKTVSHIKLADNEGIIRLPHSRRQIFFYEITENGKTVQTGKYF